MPIINRPNFKGTVTIAKSIAGPRLIAWRPRNGRTQTDISRVPYDLAMYLMLMPNKGYGFNNRLYEITNQELDDLTPDGIVLKITRRHNKIILTIN